MKNLGFLLVLLLFNAVNTFSQTTIPSGEIKSTTWTKEGSPYIIEGNIEIPDLNILTIEHGVIIKIDGSIKIKGTINAIGLKENPIVFKNNSNNKFWGEFELVDSDKSKIRYCKFENCERIIINNCVTSIANIETVDCYNGIFVIDSELILTEVIVSNCESHAVYSKNSSLKIENSLIENADIGLLSRYSSKNDILNSNILNNRSFGVSAEHSSTVAINNSIIWGNNYAFKVYVKSDFNIKKSIIQNERISSNEKLAKTLLLDNIIGIPNEIPDFEKILLFNHLSYVQINNNSIIWDIGIKNSNVPANINIAKGLETISTENKKENNTSNPQNISINKLSEVDINIPIKNNQSDYRFALIIGNEDYTKYQTNLTSEVNVDFAINDAEIFAKYCQNTLGIPEDNIILLKNAIGTEMKREINKLAKMMMYTQGKAEVIFYYAGHGIPHENTKEAYLMPVDVSAQNIEDGVKLSWLYSKLNEYNAKYVLVFLDACFTGGARNQGLLAARGVTIKPKDDIITGNCVAFTSSSDIQSSLPYKEKQHGLFTYYLLKKLQETSGNITLGDLSDYLYEKVALSSLKVNSKEQTPKTLVSPSMMDSWKEIKLNE